MKKAIQKESRDYMIRKKKEYKPYYVSYKVNTDEIISNKKQIYV